MDFLQYIYVLLNEALRSFCNCVLIYGVDVSVCLCWVGIALFSLTYFFYNFNITTPLNGFVGRKLKKGKYLNEGALGGPFHRVWKMKMIVQLGSLLVEVEDNNRDEICFDVARIIFEATVGIKFNWDYKKDLFHPNPRKARQARRAFVGKGNWDKFKETFPASGRKRLYRIATKL